MDRLGYVYYGGKYAGELNELEFGYQFSYDPAYIVSGEPISFNFTFDKLIYNSAELFPYFENLISEGWLKEVQCKTQHIDSRDSFGLLLENGRDLVGAVTILKERV